MAGRRLAWASGAWALAALALAPPLPLAPAALAQAVVTPDGLQLRVKRLPDAIELEIQNTEMAGALEQRLEGTTWVGELRTSRTRGLKAGPQSLAMPDAGMERITFDGTGRLFQLKVQPTKERPLGPPIISSDGKTMTVRFPAPPLPVSQVAKPNLSRPTPVPTPAYVPPLRPRAVAPPVGDMAVGTMTLRNRGYINISGPAVTLTTRGANARDVLMVLAQMGGYGFAYSEQRPKRLKQGVEQQPETIDEKLAPVTPITVSFRNENYERAFNFVLATAGLQARREGNTVMVGPAVLQSVFGPQVSKVYRLNQASPDSAADYMANLGALVTKTFTETITATTGVPLSGASTTNPQTTRTSTEVKVQQYGGESGPLVGLRATTDTRLSTITLVGEGPLVAVAEQYLRQLDLRQRQVALTVRILDVQLDNDTELDNSFAFRFGNNFIVNDGGQLLAAFGRNLPARSNEFEASPATFEDGTLTYENPALPNTYQYNVRTDGALGTATTQSGLSSQTGQSSLDSFDNSITVSLENNRALTQEQVSAINASLVRESGARIQEFEVERTFFVPNPNAGVEGELPFIERTVTNQEYRVVPVGQTSQSLSSTALARAQELITSTTGSRAVLSRSQTGSRSASATGSTTGLTDALRDRASRTFFGSATRRNPGLNYPDQEFFDFLRAQIVSSNTKVLASPTLILQEGGVSINDKEIDKNSVSNDGQIGRSRSNEAYVSVGTQLVKSYEVNYPENGGVICEPQFANAGLTFGARVDKIDDNGFVTFSLSPEISAQVGLIDTTGGACGATAIINSRQLDTGQVRVRDGQTLILTGVISDLDQQTVTKWPILGDIPLIGQFFRRTSGSRSKSELVVMVTPRIIDDGEGGSYGYGYQPSTNDARRLMYGAGSR